MNSNFVNLVDPEISLILEFLFGSVIELGEGMNIEALNFRLVCKKFRQVFDRLVYLSLNAPIRNRCCPPSEISSLSMFSCYEITEQDWENAFGDKLDTVKSRLEYLHVNAYSVKYLPKFTCLESISWEVGGGYYDLLKEIPYKELIITKYNTKNGSIAHLTRLREIKITIRDSEHKLIDKYLPSTILRMTIYIYPDVTDIIDLSKFRSLEYLDIVPRSSNEQIIEELILPPSLYKFYSSVKIKKMNLHECKKLELLELKLTRKWDRKWDITIPYLPNLCDLRMDSYGGSYSIDTRTLMRIESLTVGVTPQRDTQWSVEFDGLDSYIKTNYAISFIPLCRNLVELVMEGNNYDNYDIKNLVIILDIKNEYLDYITGIGFDGIEVVIKLYREIEDIDIDTDKLNVIHEKK
jgi:hypothetical protein